MDSIDPAPAFDVQELLGRPAALPSDVDLATVLGHLVDRRIKRRLAHARPPEMWLQMFAQVAEEVIDERIAEHERRHHKGGRP